MKDKRSSWAPALVLAALFLVCASLALPAMHEGPVRNEYVELVSSAKQLFIASEQAALDRQQCGEGKFGFPAESEVSTSTDYLRNLIANDYLKSADAVHLKADRFVFANTSVNDSPDTILFVSRNYYDAVLKKGRPKKPFLVIRRNGEGQVYQPNWFTEHPDKIGQLPPRDPPFLAP